MTEFWTASSIDLWRVDPSNGLGSVALAVACAISVLSSLIYVLGGICPPTSWDLSPRLTLAIIIADVLTLFHAQWIFLFWPLVGLLHCLPYLISNDYKKPLDIAAVVKEYKTTRVMDLVAEQQNRQLSKAKPPQ